MSVTDRTSNLRVDSIWFVVVTEQNMSRWGVDEEIYIKAWTIQHLWEIKDIWESWETKKIKSLGLAEFLWSVFQGLHAMNVKFCLSRTPSFSTERDKTEYLFSMVDRTNKKATLGQLSGSSSSSRLQPPGIFHPVSTSASHISCRKAGKTGLLRCWIWGLIICSLCYNTILLTASTSEQCNLTIL